MLRIVMYGKFMSKNHDNLVIIGAGGHAKVIADIARACGLVVRGYLDDNAFASMSAENIIGTTNDIDQFDSEQYFVVGIGNNQVRQRLMEDHIVTWRTLIHPSAVIAPDVAIGEGTVIMANAVINPGSTIGRGCIVNTSATIDHDCVIGDYVHISPGAHLAGNVSVGLGVWVGIGAIVSNGISICDGATIGAGAVVVRDVMKRGTYVGVPARLSVWKTE